MSDVVSPAAGQTKTDYEYVGEFYRSKEDLRRNRPFTTSRLDVDWERAVQWSGFQALRDGLTQILPNGNEHVEIQPLWHESLGPPIVRGAHVVLSGDGFSSAVEVSTEFFANSIRIAQQREIKRGVIASGESLIYQITAFAKQRASSTCNNTLSIESVEQCLKISDASVADYLNRCEPSGKLGDDFPVFVVENVIAEAIEHLKTAGPLEVGGVLVGNFFRDRSTGNLFAEIAAQVFAHSAQSELTQLTFTPETWAEVEATIKLRGRDEQWLGWWHTHPARAWCSRCPVENRKRCKLSGEFFSSQDEVLHRAIFPQAYGLGLVISDSYASGITWPMFGWRRGIIAQRGFYILNNHS